MTNLTTTNNDTSGTNYSCWNLSDILYCGTKEGFVEKIQEYMFPAPGEWFMIVLHISVFFVGIVGNFLVCFVVWRSKHMQTVTNLFIVNLAVADFLVVFICLPPTVLQEVTEHWFFGEMMCKIAPFLQVMSVSCSVLTLCAISVERYYAICHPLKSRISFRKVIVTIISIWVFAALVAVPNLIYMTMLSTYSDVPGHLNFCAPLWSHHTDMAYSSCLVIGLYLIPILVISVFYSIIARHLWVLAVPGVTVQRCNNHPNHAEAQLISRRKVAKMLIAIVVLFAVCYIPVHALFLFRSTGWLGAIGKDSTIIPMLYVIAHWLCYFNSAINPVIYNFMSMKFRAEFRCVFSCKPAKRARCRHGGMTVSTKYKGVATDVETTVGQMDSV